MEYLSNFPERLRELMFDRDNIKSEKLSSEIGIAGCTVRAWLRGESLILLPHAIKLADYFGCSLDYLAGKSENYEKISPRALPPFYSRVREILKACGVTRYRVTVDTLIKDSHFTNWSKGKAAKLSSACILADYLKISLDYLVGRTDY